MKTQRPRVLVVTGDGINCENETAQAFETVGFDAEIRHLGELIERVVDQNTLQANYQVVALPGGFSFGDDLTSGKVLALKIQHGLKWNLNQFAERGGLVIGICNGFQALIRLGVFGRDVSITSNSDGKFLNTWIKVQPEGARSPWLKGLGTMDLPIRHGEGRIVFSLTRKQEVLSKMEKLGQTCLRYTTDPNGSEGRLAGLCDPTGRILGLMPHPEAYVRGSAHPEWTLQPGRAGSPGAGLALFENAFREVSSS